MSSGYHTLIYQTLSIIYNPLTYNHPPGKHCRFKSPYLNITNPTPFHNIPSILIHHIWSPLLEVDSIFLLLTMFCAFSFKNKTLRRRHRMNMRESFHILVSWVKTSQGDEWKSFSLLSGALLHEKIMKISKANKRANI